MITHSIGWKVAYGPSQNIGRAMVSANHCQYGSSILVYTLKLCKDPERCIKSLADPRPTVLSSERLRGWANLDEDEGDEDEGDEDEEDEDDEYDSDENSEEYLQDLREWILRNGA